MSDRSPMTARVFIGLVVLTLGVLWTLDNLGMIDASQVVQWWPLIALTWGLMHVLGLGARRRMISGLIWVIVGGVSLLNTLDITHVSVFDLWPMFLLVVGGSMVLRGWRGTSSVSGSTDTGSRLNASAFMAASERKIVAQDFRGGDATAVMAGLTVDLRAARLVDEGARLDVYAMWGGIEILVPEGWRIVGDVTPILGSFQDTTLPTTDPSAPTLTVRGEAVMGGIEVMHSSRLRKRYEDGAFIRVKAGIDHGPADKA
jgi:Domain of unknown function (DUF5668)